MCIFDYYVMLFSIVFVLFCCRFKKIMNHVQIKWKSVTLVGVVIVVIVIISNYYYWGMYMYILY